MAITKIGDKFRKYNVTREVNGVYVFSIAGYEFGVKDEAIAKAMKNGKVVVVEGIVEYTKPGHFIKDRFKINGLGSSTEVENNNNNNNKGVSKMNQEKEIRNNAVLNKEEAGMNNGSVVSGMMSSKKVFNTSDNTNTINHLYNTINSARSIAQLKNDIGIDSQVYLAPFGFRAEFRLRKEIGCVFPAISVPLGTSLCIQDLDEYMHTWLCPIVDSELVNSVLKFFNGCNIGISYEGLYIDCGDIDSSVIERKDAVPMEKVQLKFRILTYSSKHEPTNCLMGVFSTPIEMAQMICKDINARDAIMDAYVQEYVKMIHDTVCRKTGFTKSSVTMTGKHCADNPEMVDILITVGGEDNSMVRVMVNDFDTAVQDVENLMIDVYDVANRSIRPSTPNVGNKTSDDVVENCLFREQKKISKSVYDIISEFESQYCGSICSIEFLTPDKSIIKITARVGQIEEVFILHNDKVYKEVFVLHNDKVYKEMDI